MKLCSRCNKQPRQRSHAWCSECHSAYARERYRAAHTDSRMVQDLVSGRGYRKNHPANRMWQSARERARKKNLPFSLELRDIEIPTLCPVLGIPLDKRDLWHTPSLDRLIPEKGYVPENVCVISYRANSIKQNATAEELRKVYEYAANGPR